MPVKMPQLKDGPRLLLSIFLPLYAMNCVEQIYFIYGTVLRQYEFTPQTTGLILGSFFIAIMLCRPVGGWMIENLGIRRTLAVGSAVGFAGCAVLFAARSVPLLVAGRLLSGAAYGVFTIGLFSYQALHVTEKIRGSAYAITGTGGILPTSTVTPIGEWLVLKGCLAAYLAIGPILCVACFLLGRRIGDGDRAAGNKAGSWGKYSDLLSNRPFVMLAATSTAMALADALAVSVSLLAADRGLVTSYFLASCSVTALIVRLGGAKLLNSLPRAFCLAPCGMLMAGAFMAVSISPSNRAFLICGGIFGIGIGAGFPMMLASVSDVLPPQLRPKGTASALLLYDAGWAVTPLLVGYLTPAMGTGRAFGLLALFAFLALAALFIFYWMPKQGRKLYAR